MVFRSLSNPTYLCFRLKWRDHILNPHSVGLPVLQLGEGVGGFVPGVADLLLVTDVRVLQAESVSVGGQARHQGEVTQGGAVSVSSASASPRSP